MRVLLVEDDHKVAAFVAQGLTEEGHAVTVAHDGERGLEAALAGEHDVMVLDYMLPRRNGVEVAAALRAAGSRLPILLLTALDPGTAATAAYAAGVDDFLAKPFRFDDLLQRLDALAVRKPTGT